MKGIRIRSAKPKIKSPFIKNQQAFPKDFFSNEDPMITRNSIENSFANQTFESNPEPAEKESLLTKENSKSQCFSNSNLESRA